MVASKEQAHESEGTSPVIGSRDLLTSEQKFKQKCGDLKKRIAEIEQSNEIAVLALSRTRTSIRRFRLEYAVLLERLEDTVFRHTADGRDVIARPGLPVLLDETLNLRSSKLGNQRATDKPDKSNTKRAVKDGCMPKMPTSAYAFFCDERREELRATFEAQNPGLLPLDFTRHLVETWKGLDAEHKAPYVLRHEKDKERYVVEMRAYSGGKSDGDGAGGGLGEDVGEGSGDGVGDVAEGTGDEEGVSRERESGERGEAENGATEAQGGAGDDKDDAKLDGCQRGSSAAENAVWTATPADTAAPHLSLNNSESGCKQEKSSGSGVAKSEDPGASGSADARMPEADCEPPAKKVKLKRTVTASSNGRPRFTIKLRSPSAPQ